MKKKTKAKNTIIIVNHNETLLSAQRSLQPRVSKR
jgi:hypothetical protein